MVTDEDVRKISLKLAISSVRFTEEPAEQVIDRASKYEHYIRFGTGEEED